MYSVNRIADETTDGNGQAGNAEDARHHKDISPELKEVMHLLKAMETGADRK